MADKAISELVAAEQIKSTDMFVLEQDGTAKRLQGQTLLNWLTAAADGHGGISNIAKTGTDGLADTYTITLADTTTKTFTVTNGNGLTNFEKVSTEGLVDNYRFTRTDGTFFDFSVYNGAKGDKGEDSHVWIKYASQQPTADSHSMGDLPDAWMGVYSGTAAEAPDDWQQYTWYQIKGEKGDTGAAATVTGTTVEYMVSDSGTIVPSGSWSTTIPTVPQGKYLWTKVTTTFNTGSPAVSYSVTRMGIDGAGSVSSVNEKSPDESGNVSLSAEDIPTSGGRSVQAVLDDKQEALTAGENISISGSVIATKAFPCNPNLLDNWYFGNPVDQREGYIVPSGVNYFLPDQTQNFPYAGTTTQAYRVERIDTSGSAFIKVNGTEYFVPAGGGIVCGYCGTGYTIDRWIRRELSETVTLNEGYASITGHGGNFDQMLGDDIPKYLRGKEVTLSILARGNVAIIAEDFTNSYSVAYLQSETFTVVSKTMTVRSDADRFVYHIQPQDGNPVDIVAVGLELGSQQTLAHQENGVWVLNEIPDYGEQLRRCQRYYYKPYHVLLWRTPGANSLTVDANFKVDMRAVPAAIYTNPLTVLVPGKTANGSITLSNLVVNVGGVGNCDLTSVDPSDAEVLQIEGAQIAFSADL